MQDHCYYFTPSCVTDRPASCVTSCTPSAPSLADLGLASHGQRALLLLLLLLLFLFRTPRMLGLQKRGCVLTRDIRAHVPEEALAGTLVICSCGC